MEIRKRMTFSSIFNIRYSIFDIPFFIFIFILISVMGYSQDTTENRETNTNSIPMLHPVPTPDEEIFYRYSLQGGGNIIYPITNKAVRISLAGIYYVHFSFNYVVLPHLFAGVELEDYDLGTGQYSGYPTPLSMFTYGAGVKVGYYTWMQHDFLFCYSLSAGQTYIKFQSVPPQAPPVTGGYHAEAPFFTPNMFIGYRVNNTLRIGLEISYIFNFYQFNPDYLGLETYNTYTNKDMEGITTSFTWGFGIYDAFSEHGTVAPKKQPEQ